MTTKRRWAVECDGVVQRADYEVDAALILESAGAEPAKAARALRAARAATRPVRCIIGSGGRMATVEVLERTMDLTQGHTS